MARDYFCMRHSFLDSLEQLDDAEAGRLFRALLVYSRTGTAQPLEGNERFLFPSLKAQIDKDAKEYAEVCEKRRENILQRYIGTNKDKQEKVKSAKAKEHSGSVLLADAGTDLQNAFADWLSYKAERREAYKPTGLRSLETEIRNNAARYGETAVAELIRLCMASGYRGIIFDRLKQTNSKTYGPNGIAISSEENHELDGIL